MGQSYSNPTPSPAGSADRIEFYWREDIQEYDTNNFSPQNLDFNLYEEDIFLTIDNLKNCSNFGSKSQPSVLFSIVFVVLINIIPLYFYIQWSIDTNGKYLWTLSLIPIYLALNAALPLLVSLLQRCLIINGNKKSRNAQFNPILIKLNDRNFKMRGFRAEYNQETFSLSFLKC